VNYLKSIKGIFNHQRNGDLDFVNSTDYWIKRYEVGGNSGAGSYGILAEYKAQFLNDFVKKNSVSSVIEFGCGDGNNLGLFDFPNYLGLDISDLVIKKNRQKFKNDLSLAFLVSNSQLKFSFKADLTLSLDVIYHLIEDTVFESYMSALFDASNQFVIIYSSNEDYAHPSHHVQHRKFDKWIEKNRPNYKLYEEIRNPQKAELTGSDSDRSFADFFVFKRIS
jgi:SAM-dependent methyltransferase